MNKNSILKILLYLQNLFLFAISILYPFINITNRISLNHFTFSTPYYQAYEAKLLWTQKYVQQISYTTHYQCPNQFQPLFQSTWKGSYQGCYCQIQNQFQLIHLIQYGKCKINLDSWKCKYVPHQSKQSIRYWKKKDQLICVKRTQFSMLELPQECKTNCTGGCVTSQLCPITNFDLNEQNLSISRDGLQSFVYFELKRDDRQSYKLQIQQQTKIKHYNSTQLSRISKGKQLAQQILLEANPSLFAKLNNLPNYPPVQDSKYYLLMGFSYPSMKLGCFQLQQTGKQRTQQIFSLSLIESLYIWNVVIGIVIGIFIIMVKLYVLISQLYKKNISPIFSYILIPIAIFPSITLIYQTYLLNSYQKYFQVIKSNNCSTLDFFLKYQQLIKQGSFNTIILWILYVLLILLELLRLIAFYKSQSNESPQLKPDLKYFEERQVQGQLDLKQFQLNREEGGIINQTIQELKLKYDIQEQQKQHREFQMANLIRLKNN